ncbi:ribonuclease G [Candidatus Venteria ishoeyi]|uniref:Ribonuclease G n=1 Tax=Candidatus Venteria ishoeyi TaxID=1899563 RepID=A0A1H6FGI0_9GAMM|nr:ribonuclease G [Candidatus Venteria ishoeyi]MDM8547119.1 ribonuclease G [Candidatus Venteria ishoeyi]SEH08266.1 Ribonuclease G [Candidatus Venteria ishoeyi]
MSEEVLINVTPRETRVAVVENGVLQEVIVERVSKRGLVGNIYKGRVCRVLPGMQAAFVDVGLERAAFLHASDINLPPPQSNNNISEILHEGQNLLVQVIKNPLGTKGARLTTQISIPSRYLVFLPDIEPNIGVSQRIIGTERERLLMTVKHYMETGKLWEEIDEQAPKAGERFKCGFIIRTAADGVEEDTLQADMEFLSRIWKSIQIKAREAKPASLVYEDFPLKIRTMRDMSGMNMTRVLVDSRSSFLEMTAFAEEFIPDIHPLLEYYTGERPIFDLYNVEEEITVALKRHIELKSGGYLIIEQTEAMTTIDVNTGKFVGHRNLEETIYKTNLEATQAIVRQIRLRNLGGIIILDLIDMVDSEHRRQVLRSLEKHLEKDHAKTHISDISALGLVQMTRKRTRESLEHILCDVCPTCNGRGTVKSAETICYEILREITREARQFDAQNFLVYASEEVVDLLIEESETIEQLEHFIDGSIRFQIEPHYIQEQYDIVLA